MRALSTIVMTSALTVLMVVGNANGQTAGERRDDSITKKLDEILRRLETIESRLAELEAQSFNRWRVDDRGILLDGSGKPVGFWGIDSVAPRAVRR